MLRFSGAGVSDVGRQRDLNEDSAFVGPYVLLVADGVGGAAAGEVASATTTHAVVATVLARTGEPPDAVLRAGVAAARESVHRGARLDPRRDGMATTLTAIACDGERAVLGHLGDSRAYLLRSGRLERLSHDHTVVQELVDGGDITPDQARRHPWRHVVVRTVGADPGVPLDDLDVTELELRPGDRVLVCSDGLTDLVADARITELLGHGDPTGAASRLTQAALCAGGTDNVTCVVADVVDGPRIVGDGQLLGAVRAVENLLDPGLVRSS